MVRLSTVPEGPVGPVEPVELPEVTRVREVPEFASENARSFLRSDGAIETVVSAAPEQPGAVADLVPGERTEIADGALTVPEDSSGAVVLDTAAGSIRSTLRNFGGKPAETVAAEATDGASVVYPGVADSVDLRVERTPRGVKEVVVVGAPDSVVGALSWTLEADGLGLSQDGQGVVFTDADGELVGVIPAPFMRDSAGAVSENVRVGLRAGGPGWVYELTPDPAWLADPGRVYPVEIDPPLSVGADEDCALRDGAVWTCSWDTIGVSGGSTKRNSVLAFDVNAALAGGSRRAHVNVQFAELGLKDQNPISAGPIDAHVITTAWNGSANWNSPWTNPGGDYVSSPIPATGQGLRAPDAFTNAAGWRYWFLTDAVQDWVDDPASNEGVLLLKAAPGASPHVYFHSSDATSSADRPVLKIVWYPDFGATQRWGFEEFPLSTDRNLRVNVGNGNAGFAGVSQVVAPAAVRSVVVGHVVTVGVSHTTLTGARGGGHSQWRRSRPHHHSPMKREAPDWSGGSGSGSCQGLIAGFFRFSFERLAC